MNFQSDNTAPISPKVMQAILNANEFHMHSYGHDQITQHARQKFNEIFERDVDVFFVATGTAANCLALSTITPPFGAIYCHPDAHIATDEASAPEATIYGTKLIGISGPDGKMTSNLLRKHVEMAKAMRPHRARPSVISLSQSTESGTLYSVEEIQQICQVGKEFGLSIHMDGARFSNAVVASGETPAALTWQAGVDVLCLGGTKNGGMAAEAVIFFNKDLAKEADYQQKRQGQLLSKTRYFSCQFLALFEDGLWLRNALHANLMATRVAEILLHCEGVRVLYPVDVNEVFAHLPPYLYKALREHGATFYDWGISSDHHFRFVTSAYTHVDEIQAL